MAKINVTGDMIQVVTSLTEEDFELAQQYKPEALKIMDDKGNEVFGITRGDAHLSKYGISFCSKDVNNKLFLTVNNPVTDHSDIEKERQQISRCFAQVINNLEIIETQVATEKPNIRAMEQNTARAIHINGEPTCDCKCESDRNQ